MNKLLLIAGVLIITGCHSNNSDTVGNNSSDSIGNKAGTGVSIDTTCYAYTNHRDSILMNIVTVGNSINGTLSYSYFQKDKNTGTIVGNINNDTLIAEYNFMSEGIQSARDLVFVKKNNAWMQGYGEMIEDGNKLKFKDRGNLIFDTLNLLQETNCE